MICPNCGHETLGKFCPICGTKLAAENAAPAASQAGESGYASNQSQDYATGQNSGYAPGQNYAQDQNQYYGQNQNQNYPPNQGYGAPGYGAPGYGANQQPYNSGFAYNQNANPGYVPQQGFNPGPQVIGGYQDIPPGALGQSPASRLVRTLASSPLYLIAAILTTVSIFIAVFYNVKALIQYFKLIDAYRSYYGTSSNVTSAIVTAIVTVLFNLFTILALWRIYANAVSKRAEQMRTGSLTYYKVLFVIALVVLILVLIFVVVLMIILISSQKYSSFFKDAYRALAEALARAGYEFPNLKVELRTYLYIFFGVYLALALLAVIYVAKLIKTINTAKRVIQTGVPDDRVSIFAAVIIILGSLFSVYNGIRYFVDGNGSAQVILMGIAMLLSAAANIIFAVMIFQFRSGMRSLGVRHGMIQY